MSIGIYLHVPFCGKKCPYCDFYSGAASKPNMDRYTDYLEQQLLSYQGKGITADTLYFGGGTPNLLGGERLSRLIHAAKNSFSLSTQSEITVEGNPFSITEDFLRQIHNAGASRLSLGMQSANETELQFLGRRHTPEQVQTAVAMARDAGFSNLSLDLMLAIPHQTADSLCRSIAFCAELDVEHVSSYLLKIEPNTAFFAQQNTLSLPEEDEVSKRYRLAVSELQAAGYAQYEISNFSKPGYEGRHNLKYWHCEPYLGFGPSAHSYFDGKRFYYLPSLEEYLSGKPPVQDGEGGSEEETAMLQLRLTEGLSDALWQQKFGKPLPSALFRIAKRYEKPGLIQFDSPTSFHFTPEGFLVSNLLIVELLEAF